MAQFGGALLDELLQVRRVALLGCLGPLANRKVSNQREHARPALNVNDRGRNFCWDSLARLRKTGQFTRPPAPGPKDRARERAKLGHLVRVNRTDRQREQFLPRVTQQPTCLWIDIENRISLWIDD